MSKALLALLALVALSGPLPAQDPPGDVTDPACPADTICIARRDAHYSFSFRYPRAAAQIPALEALLQAEAATGEAWLGAHSQPAGEAPPFSYEAGWRIDAQLPELVAASAAIGHHTGGAHGGIEYRAILIDPRRGRRLVLADLFRPGFLESRTLGDRIHGVWAVQDAFCRALTAEVRDRRDDPAAAVACPNIEEQPVTLLCGANGRIDRMRALLNAYVVGSWAEGPYKIEFPIDAMIMDGMKRRYRSAFGLARESRPRSPLRPCR